MADARTITKDDLICITTRVAYDKNTGVFTRIANSNKHKIGTTAGLIDKKGYRQIEIGGRAYTAHRLAWVLVYGLDNQPSEIRHLNNIRDDNRIENLHVSDYVFTEEQLLHSLSYTPSVNHTFLVDLPPKLTKEQFKFNKNSRLITQEELDYINSRLSCDPQKGILTWKTVLSHVSKVGEVAGCLHCIVMAIT